MYKWPMDGWMAGWLAGWLVGWLVDGQQPLLGVINTRFMLIPKS